MAKNGIWRSSEKVSGAGYMDGLKGEDIPIPARIFAIVDVFDALTSKRPYKEPFSYEDTMLILEEGRGSHFDPELLDAFSGIARSLYNRLSGTDATPSDELDEIVRTYFVENVDLES